MSKFISFDARKFETRKFANGSGWQLFDISVNVDAISIVMRTDTVHTVSKYDIDTDTTKTFKYPCTVLVTHDGTELTVLGSYKETLSKINGEIKNEI